MMVGRRSFPVGKAYFQGRTVKLREGKRLQKKYNNVQLPSDFDFVDTAKSVSSQKYAEKTPGRPKANVKKMSQAFSICFNMFQVTSVPSRNQWVRQDLLDKCPPYEHN